MGYCQVTDVLNLIPPQLATPITDPDIMEKPVSTQHIEWYIEHASEIINSIISQLYPVPLVKIITVNKSTEEETEEYPYPINKAAAMLAASYLYRKLYSESQNPQEVPKFSEGYQDQVLKLLNNVLAGTIGLKGQRMIGRRYLRPESMNVNRIPIEFKDLASGA